ncbi:ribosomal RNA processing protein 1-like protein [Iris pallida]|uniref:Ribosomal RNA processing protein 1-like protein n=1 Tax=Iris pallida TaxID=29817 RepID=A0AAX6HTL4_IRIPA|nr:ribosomal RNA processing protein 1-like protein [Iris pallida]
MKNCELCSGAARLVCESDEASLCFDCDAKVHGANFLVARHQRLLLCRRCQSPTPWRADGPRLGPTVSLCRRCLLHKYRRHHDDDDEGESRRNQEEEEEEDDDDDDEEEEGEEGEEEEEGEEQVVPWAIEDEQEGALPPLVASSSSSEEEAAATTERNGLLKRTRENAADRPTCCSSFSRDRLSNQPWQQPVRTGLGCNIDDEATSDSFRPLKSRKNAATPFRSAPRRSAPRRRLAAVDLTFSSPPRRSVI